MGKKKLMTFFWIMTILTKKKNLDYVKVFWERITDICMIQRFFNDFMQVDFLPGNIHQSRTVGQDQIDKDPGAAQCAAWLTPRATFPLIGGN